MEDHVRGHALFLRCRAAPRAKLIEHHRIRLGKLGGGGCRGGRAGGPGGLGLRDPDRVVPQPDLPPTVQNLVACRGAQQRPVVTFDGQNALRQQLPNHRAPLEVGKVLADAEHAQRVVPVLADLIRLLAEQDVDHLARAELLAPLALEPDHGRQQLLRGQRAVPGLRRREARVAVAALAGLLPEVAEHLRAAALDRLAESQHRVQVGRLAAPVRQVTFGGVDQLAQQDDVLQAVGHPGGRGQAVPSGPAGLLVVALHGPGQVEVGDEAHVGLVDAHAERDRGDHEQAIIAEEPCLVGPPGGRVEARVVGEGLDPAAHQELRGRLDRRPGQAVDDARAAGVLGLDQPEQLPPRLVLRNDAVLDIWAVEARDEMPRPGEVQPLRDLGARRVRRRRRERDARHRRPALVQRGQLQVVGPEVVSPLGHAVRLVDGEQRDRAAVQQPQRGLGAQPLWCQVEQVEPPGDEVGLDLTPLARCL